MYKKAVLSIIVFITTAINYGLKAQQALKNFNLEEVWYSRNFYPQTPVGMQSMKDGEHYYVIEEDEQNNTLAINVYTYKDGKKVKTLFTQGDVTQANNNNTINIEDIQFNDAEDKVLIATEGEQIYRHSSKYNYYIYNITEKNIIKLSDKGKQRLASFSPDGTKVAFIRDNNLYYFDLTTKKETAITTDGALNNIIYGTTDWVYEEEFGFTNAYFWAPESNKIAYYRFDESRVKQFTMTLYGKLYPENYEYKYPKAGEDNSLVTIHVYDIAKANSTAMDIGTETNQYIPRILWSKTQDKLAIYRLNRLQNHLQILLADANTGKHEIIYNETNKYYIEINDNIYFFNDKNTFLISSEKDGFNHLYLYNFKGEQVKQITSGKWEVTELHGVDEKNKWIYFASTQESPADRTLVRMSIDGKKSEQLSKRKGYNNAEFSANYKYFLHTYSNANTPHEYAVCLADGKEISSLQKNEDLKALLQQYQISPREFFTFKTSENIELNGWMMKPANFDPNKKYPVLMFVYGGPGSQEVLNRWDYNDYLWNQLMTQKGYFVVCVDNRGTGGRGEEFKKCTYLQLGNLETIDQIEAAKYLGTLPYIDSKRIGIFGWSYGGYMSTLCITKGADYFNTAIAVAPVINWRYYDNIYTERYMRTPQENPKGYDDNSPVSHAHKLKGKYLLIHGMADDNVHMQNAVTMADALIKKNIPFEMMYYPNKNHGIYGEKTRLHLFTKITKFIETNL